MAEELLFGGLYTIRLNKIVKNAKQDRGTGSLKWIDLNIKKAFLRTQLIINQKREQSAICSLYKKLSSQRNVHLLFFND